MVSHSLLQRISSEPSPQSSAPLHHSMLDTQRPLLHWRKVFLQRRVSAERGGKRPRVSSSYSRGAASDETSCTCFLDKLWGPAYGPGTGTCGSALHKLPKFLLGPWSWVMELLLLSLPFPALLGSEAGDRRPGVWGRRWLLTAVGRLLVRLVLAVGDAITGQAEVDALTIGTLKLILCSARGIHRCGGGEELHGPGPWGPECPCPCPPVRSHSVSPRSKVPGAGLLDSLGRASPQ